jgi:four helix bundle protein
MKIYFDHEKLDVYRASIEFCAWVGDFLAWISGKAAAKDQLDRASTSVPLNIAEGNAKFSSVDGARFFEIARGSAVECAACLDVLVARKFSSVEQIAPQKEQLIKIVQMLIGLLRRFSEHADLLREEAGNYGREHDYEHEHEQE